MTSVSVTLRDAVSKKGVNFHFRTFALGAKDGFKEDQNRIATMCPEGQGGWMMGRRECEGDKEPNGDEFMEGCAR